MMQKKLFIIASSIVMTAAAILIIHQIIAAANRTRRPVEVDISAPQKLSALTPDAKDEILPVRLDVETQVKALEEKIAKMSGSTGAEHDLIALARLYEKKGDYLKAKECYKISLERFPTSKDVASTLRSLGEVNIKIVLSPEISEGATMYEIRKGDSLTKIAHASGTTVELITKVNALKGPQINFGKKLKVPSKKFSVVVDTSQNILMLKADGEVIRTYDVSTGAKGATPIGTFKVVNRIQNPVWYTTGAIVPAGSPKNILGTRWLGISRQGYGIHGTTEPGMIGQSVTAGCVRMRNSDVEELYLFIPEGTEVIIAE